MPELTEARMAVRSRGRFEVLRNRAAPKTKGVGVKAWALMREKALPSMKKLGGKTKEFVANKAAPKARKFGRERAIPAMIMAVRYGIMGGKKAGGFLKDRGLPAMRTAGRAAIDRTITAYEKTREQIITRKYGDTATARVAKVAALADIGEINALRVAGALVKAGYSRKQAAMMLEELHERAMNHPAAQNRRVAKNLAGLAIIAAHDAIKFGGAHPEDAYYAAMRMITEAKREQIQALVKMFKERMKNPAQRNAILQVMEPYIERQMTTRRFLAEAEPTVLWGYK